MAVQPFNVSSDLTPVVTMGAANAVFQRNREVNIGVTYNTTGTLVKLGQHATVL